MMKRILVIFRFILIFSVFFLTDISLFYNEFCCNFCLGKGTFIPFVSGFICDGRENGLDRLLFAESTYFFEIPVDTIINDGEYWSNTISLPSPKMVLLTVYLLVQKLLIGLLEGK